MIKKIQGYNKFTYDLYYVINTTNYIIGKEYLENDYQIMSGQKWMRKFTEKKFKRIDLILRNEHKCLIIDWKFTRLHAKQKIRGSAVQKKNDIYMQLARKDFKTDVELKFYCQHEPIVNKYYHFFTSAPHQISCSVVNIEGEEQLR